MSFTTRGASLHFVQTRYREGRFFEAKFLQMRWLNNIDRHVGYRSTLQGIAATCEEISALNDEVVTGRVLNKSRGSVPHAGQRLVKQLFLGSGIPFPFGHRSLFENPGASQSHAWIILAQQRSGWVTCRGCRCCYSNTCWHAQVPDQLACQVSLLHDENLAINGIHTTFGDFLMHPQSPPFVYDRNRPERDTRDDLGEG